MILYLNKKESAFIYSLLTNLSNQIQTKNPEKVMMDKVAERMEKCSEKQSTKDLEQ